jgi:hypothetical protein
MAKILPAFSKLAEGGVSKSEDTDSTSAFNLVQDIFGDTAVGLTNYYNYQGSLTTPNCTEGITWFLMANTLPISPAQVLAFTSTLASQQGGVSRGGDNRLIQPLGTRTISASFKPAASAAVLITGAIKFEGVTAAEFTYTLRNNFMKTISTSLNVPLSAVNITSVATTSTRRSLRAVGLNIAYSVAAPTAAAAQVISSQLNGAQASTSALSAALLVAMAPAGPTGIVVITGAGTGGPAPVGGALVPAPPAPVPAVSAAPRAAGAVVAVVAAAAAALAF